MILISSTTKLPHGEIVSANMIDFGSRGFPMRFCWVFAGIYRSGFKTRPEAENWGKKEGLIF
jgi:hypothetical protein